MRKIIAPTPRAGRIRKIVKWGFWLGLIFVMILPIATGIFKARMLPKSNQNQVYLWIDAPREYTAKQGKEIAQEVENFFLLNKKLPKDLQVVENVSSTVGTPFLPDFSNLFRG